ncbi:acetyl-CoA carboxylase carboxyltransferase subunit beta [bacterium]|nr:acetyl-CoA carboxylase carboxyltransferase subunit beta [bacterium]
MKWFKRVKGGILTTTNEKKEIPDGLWWKCPECKEKVTTKELKENLSVCPKCNHHARIGSTQYFEILFDNNEFTELDPDLKPADPLHFVDTKPYPERVVSAQKKTKLNDAARTAYGKIDGNMAVVACMDFEFIGGSMGSVVGEKISRAIDHALKHRYPMIIISKSGGARMMEAAFSLMQMAKTSAKLALLSEARIPYFSILTDPTTGGVTASFAMLGDINIAEPKALIGFAGPRVIKETIKKDLPDGFQRSEFLLEHGLVDIIAERKDLKATLANLMATMKVSRKKKSNKKEEVA